MRTISHAPAPELPCLEITVPEGWKESFEDDLLTLTRGERGVGALQVSLAPHLYEPDILPPKMVSLAEQFAAQGADGPVVGQRVWRRTAARTSTAPRQEVIAATAGAPRGEWFVQCFIIRQGESIAFATYVCRAADRPAEIDAAEQILQTIEIRPPQAKS